VPPCQFVVVPSTLLFADVEVDQTVELSFEVENVGSNICLIQGPSLTDDPTGAFRIASMSIQPDPATGRVAIPPPGMGAAPYLVVTLAFSPTVIGPAAADLVLAGEGSQITGTGVP
jgi:hypothetical protein